MKTFKTGNFVIVTVNNDLAIKYPRLSDGDELACEVIGVKYVDRKAVYTVMTGPMSSFLLLF